MLQKTKGNTAQDIIAELDQLKGVDVTNLKNRLQGSYYANNTRQAFLNHKLKVVRQIEELDKAIQYANGQNMNPFDIRVASFVNEFIGEAYQNSDVGFASIKSRYDRMLISLFRTEMRNWNLARKRIEADKDAFGNSVFEKLKHLEEINAELALLQPLTRLNQGLYNSVADQINFIDKFETIITKRAKRAKITSTKALKEFATLNKELFGENNYRIDMNRFIHDKTYQDAACRAYDSIKCMVNPLRVILNVEHYLGYLTTMNANYSADELASGKYRMIHKMVKEVFPGLRLNSTSKLRAIKRTQQFYDLIINNEFLGRCNELYPITIKEGKYYDESGKLVSLNGGEITLDLRTENGKASFKYWMEHIVFPRLKDELKGINSFIDDIYPTKQNFVSSTMNAVTCYTLPTSMLPKKGSEEEQKLIKYKNQLAALDYNHKVFGNLFNLIYIYNTIVYNG